MNERTVNLDMPFIMPSQAQKHVTHNEALLRLDALVHLSIIDEQQAPPDFPALGDRFLVAPAASGAWIGHDGRIAIYQDGYWAFAVPGTGWQAWFATGGRMKVFDGSEWQDLPLPENGGLATLGISTTADETNRLALSAPASLFTHAGGDHRLKINKAGASDTASLLFQSNWTGHAEMGLAGNTDFSIKVSTGGEWKTGLTIDGAGRVRHPSQPAARVFRSGTSFSPAAGQQSGFTDFSINQGDFALGSLQAGGGNALVVPAGGLYFLSVTIGTTASSAFGVTILRNGGETVLSLNGPAGNAATVSANAILQLDQGDTLTLGHSGTASIALGSTRTVLSIALI